VLCVCASSTTLCWSVGLFFFIDLNSPVFVVVLTTILRIIITFYAHMAHIDPSDRALISPPQGMTHVQTMGCGSCANENAIKAAFISHMVRDQTALLSAFLL
jgi:hypothetical protein